MLTFFLIRRLPDPIKSDPVVRKKKFQHIWKEEILINYKNSKNIVFEISLKSIINEDVHSIAHKNVILNKLIIQILKHRKGKKPVYRG